MPKLITGYVQSDPDFRYAGIKETPILKFRVQVGDSWFKRQEVVVFGKLAEKNNDLTRGEFVTLSGELKENTFRDETKLELVIGWQGNLRRHPEKPKREMVCPTGGEDDDYTPADGLAAAPRSYRGVDFGSKLSDRGPVLDNCPDYESPDPTDEEFENARAFWEAEFPRWGFLNDDTDDKDRYE